MKVVVTILIAFSFYNSSFAQYKNLVLEGGGTKGLAYAGAIKVLEDKHILQQIDNVAGTSAGSIAALMLSVGYTSVEIDSILRSTNLNKFNAGYGGIIGKVKRVAVDFGIYKVNKLNDWLGTLIEHKTGNSSLTFLQLHHLKIDSANKYKDLYCTGTNVSMQRIDIFSFKHTPNMQIKNAVNISCCIPLYYQPILLDSNLQMVTKPIKGEKYIYYVDGGLICNYPINMFDSCKDASNPLVCNDVIFNKQTLGLKLERNAQIKNFEKNNNDIAAFNIKTLKDYSFALANLTMETLNRRYPNLENEKGRTIYINQGNMKAKINNVKEEEKTKLYNNGVQAVLKFFDQKT